MKRGNLILDLGCGNGRHTVFLLKSGLKVVAVDHNRSAVRTTRAQVKALAFPKDYYSVLQEEAVPFLENRSPLMYDGVIVFDSVHHMCTEKKELSLLVENILRSLKKGGYLLLTLLTDINYSNGASPKERLNISEVNGKALLERSFCQQKVIFFKKKSILFRDIENFSTSGTFVRANYSATRLIFLVRKPIRQNFVSSSLKTRSD